MELLREFDFDTVKVKLFDDHNYTTGRHYLNYELWDDGQLIFSGNDYSPSPMDAIDSDEAITGILAFLTLVPGDTDDEYFETYEDEQLEWAGSANSENLKLMLFDFEEKYFGDLSLVEVAEKYK